MPDLIRAAVVSVPGADPVIETVRMAPLRADEVRLQVAATGVCHTDVAWALGEYGTDAAHFPAVLGHETAGVVEAVGSEDSQFRPGDRVVVSLANHCGACRDCESGSPILCGRREDLPQRLTSGADLSLAQAFGVGGFAEATVVREVNLVHVPEGVPLTLAATVGCAFACGAGAALNVAEVRTGATVVVFGAGAVGISVVLACVLAGAEQILVVDPNEARGNDAIRVGATAAVVPDEEQIASFAPPSGFDYAFECVGKPTAMEASVRWTRRGGTVTLMGAAHQDEVFSLNALEFVSSQRRLLGCLGGNVRPHDDFQRYFRLYQRGKLDLDALVTGTMPLSDAAKGFQNCRSGAGLRTLLVNP